MRRVIHAETGNHNETQILIEGLPRSITLMQITDSHLMEVDERDPETIEEGQRLLEKFSSFSPTGGNPRLHFQQALARANELDVDYVVLTGDIVHFPSAANLEALEQELKTLKAPYLYLSGNHDWLFPHLRATEATRDDYSPRFDRFTNGNFSHQVREIGGVRLIGLDNSTYQIDDAQLGFIDQQLDDDRPTLLFMHIPLYIPTLAPAVWEIFDAPIMIGAPGWTPEAQADWQVRDADPSTSAFYQLLSEGGAPSIAAIFCGHVHFAHADAFSEGQVQYVTQPGFEGGYRIITLRPA